LFRPNFRIFIRTNNRELEMQMDQKEGRVTRSDRGAEIVTPEAFRTSRSVNIHDLIDRQFTAIDGLLDRVASEKSLENMNASERLSAAHTLASTTRILTELHEFVERRGSPNAKSIQGTEYGRLQMAASQDRGGNADHATFQDAGAQRPLLLDFARSVDHFTPPRTSVVIPTLNEARNLPLLLPRLPSWLHEIIIVDGRSTDDTIEVALQYLPSAKIVRETRPGKGTALTSGFDAATGDIVVMLDADGSMDPGEIPSFVGALMAGADFVKGSRFSSGAGTDDMSTVRMLGNWGLTKAVTFLYGGRFTDLCYGYVAFWRHHVPALRSTCSGFEIETMLVIRALQAQLKIVEVASFEHPRVFGDSNLRAVPDGLRVLRTILTERVRSNSRPQYNA
jgi:Glycosyl transferase family 2